MAGKEDLKLDLQCREVALGPLNADTLYMAATASDNNILLDLLYNKENGNANYARLGSVFRFSRKEDQRSPVITAQLSSEEIVVNGKTWTLTSDSIVVSEGKLALNDVLLQHANGLDLPESLKINGTISRTPGDTLFVELSRFDVNLLNTLLPSKYPFTFRGSLTGTGHLTDFYSDRRFFANIIGRDLYVNDTLADLHLISSGIPLRHI